MPYGKDFGWTLILPEEESSHWMCEDQSGLVIA